MKVELTKTFYAESAHRNPVGDVRTQRLHGHSYRLDVVAQGEVTSEVGWLVDYGEISAMFDPVYRRLDHRCLNDIDGLDDTTLPGLRAWILAFFEHDAPWLKDVRVSILGDCAFRPVPLGISQEEGLPARLRFTFEAAQFLANLPPEHNCSNLHGHSYRVEVASEDLAQLPGPLESIYDLLDHCCLNDVPGLENTTCEIMCQWMWKRLAKQVSGLAAIVVQETNSARCIYHGE